MWTRESELLLLRWGELSQLMSMLYQQAYQQASKKEVYVKYPAMILGVVTTSSLYTQIDSCEKIGGLISFGLSMLMTLVTAVGTYISKNTESYRSTSQSYDGISRDIQEQLIRPHQERVDCQEFVHRIKNEMSHLKNAPALPSGIYATYLKAVDKHLEQMGVNIFNEEMSELIDQNTPTREVVSAAISARQHTGADSLRPPMFTQTSSAIDQVDPSPSLSDYRAANQEAKDNNKTSSHNLVQHQARAASSATLEMIERKQYQNQVLDFKNLDERKKTFLNCSHQQQPCQRQPAGTITDTMLENEIFLNLSERREKLSTKTLHQKTASG